MHHAWVSHDIILNAPSFFSKFARADASCGASNRGLDAGVLGGIVFWFGHFTSNARHCLFPQTSRESHVCKFLGGVVVLSPIAVADMAAKHLLLATLACQFLCGHAGFIFSPPHAQLSGKDDSSFIRKGHSMAEELLKVLESIAAGILQLKSKFCVTGIAWKW